MASVKRILKISNPDKMDDVPYVIGLTLDFAWIIVIVLKKFAVFFAAVAIRYLASGKILQMRL
jgi:hypothetical protein